MVELSILIIYTAIVFALGYALRGLIHREVMKIGAEVVSEITKLRAEIRQKI